jgi:dTDP-4-dehydrorhamnose reductase
MSDSAKVLVIGATGQVGTQMLRFLAEHPEHGVALPTSRGAREGWLQLDLADVVHVDEAEELFAGEALRSIYCVGGMTYVDGCEEQPDLAWRTNARGPGVMADLARRLAIPFVYFSTEYVFAGSDEEPGPYEEDSVPHPLNVYGKSKLDGEYAVLQAYPQSLVLRTTVVYGPDARRKNYLYSLIRSLSAGEPVRVPHDQISTPTYNQDLNHAAFWLVQAGASGVYHVCGPERMNRLDFAAAAAQKLGLDTSLLRGVSTEELNQRAIRPLSAGLATGKLSRLHPEIKMRTVAAALDDCIDELRSTP